MTQTTDSEAGRIERAYGGIQKLRDAHYSLSQKGDDETDAHVHTLVAAAYDKALAELRVAFHLQPQPWEEYEAKAEEPATIHKQKGN